MDIVKRFLSAGYFPVQLPPGFSTESFAKAHKKVGKVWAPLTQPTTRLEKFSVARSSYNRRITGIPNPVAYYYLAEALSTYWKSIQSHYKKSKISLSQPKLKPSDRAIKLTKFSALDELRILKSSGYKFALITDVSRYFPTIYTHVIPWAVHGKEEAKKNQKKKTAKYYGNILDEKAMGLQGWQTIGIPIGPDSSHVLAEIIGTAMDKELRSELGFWPAGYRYVDDYYLFFEKRDDAEKALAHLTRIMANYELQIHPDKTKIVEVTELVKQSWKHAVRKLTVEDEIARQRGDIHRFFERLFELEHRYEDESLVKYGLKVLSSQIIKKPNWDLMEAYLLKCGHAFPNTLQVIVRLFETYDHHGYPIDKKAVARFCNTLIKQHSVTDGHSEIAWTLWLALRLKIVIDKDAVNSVQATSSSVCLIILLHLQAEKLTRLKVAAQFLKQFTNSDALRSENWLLSYEGGRRLWLGNKDTSFISDDDYFAPLLANKVCFYNDTSAVKPLFELKADLLDSFDIDLLWQSDDDIDEFFDFDRSDQDYTDLGPKGDPDLFTDHDHPDIDDWDDISDDEY